MSVCDILSSLMPTFDPQRKGSYCWGSGLWCKVSSKLNENCDRRSGDRQTDRRTHRHE